MEKKSNYSVVVLFILCICVMAMSLHLCYSSTQLAQETYELSEEIINYNLYMQSEIETLQEDVLRLENELAMLEATLDDQFILNDSGNTAESHDTSNIVQTSYQKYDAMCIDGPSTAVHSENILEDLYYSEDGRVIVYTDEYISKNSDCFPYYYKVWKQLPETVAMESLRSSEAISSKDIVILHTNLEDELLEKAFNRLIEMDFHSPNIVILFESPSHYTEPVQELEDMILKYTSESCLSSTTIRVFYTDGMETNYYYYVE